jgi:hypothetical protein
MCTKEVHEPVPSRVCTPVHTAKAVDATFSGAQRKDYMADTDDNDEVQDRRESRTPEQEARQTLATMLEHAVRGDEASAQNLFWRRLKALDPNREIADALIAGLRGGAMSFAEQHEALSLRAKLILAESKITTLEWQIRTNDRMEDRRNRDYKEARDRVHYLEHQLNLSQAEIFKLRRQIEIDGGSMTDNELQEQLAKTELENTRLKSNRARKDRQVKAWRDEVAFLHEVMAEMRQNPAMEIPDRQWPPPSWRPDVENHPEIAAGVVELRAENARLLKEVQSWRAKYFDRTEEGAEIDRLNEEIERLNAVNERQSDQIDGITEENEALKRAATGMDAIPPRPYESRVFGWRLDVTKKSPLVSPEDPLARHYGVYQWQPGDNGKFAWAQVSEQFDYAEDANAEWHRLLAEQAAEAAKDMEDADGAEDDEEDETPPPPQPKGSGRGRHFGAYPDPATMEKIRGLTARHNLDNTALLRWLIDNEYANPPDTLPPRRKRAQRIHHFGCYPSQETWTKIRQLFERYRIDNTELLSYLVDVWEDEG